MKKKIAILGSTGSIGKTLINIIKQDKKNFEIILLSADENYKELLKQAKFFKVKNLIITNENSYNKAIKDKFSKKINIYNNFNNFRKIFRKKVDYTMSSISGIQGLKPTIEIIKYSNKIAIANKEAIICGWDLIHKELKKYKTEFIPVDSEHFSIWYALKDINKDLIEKIYLTASGGPFLNKPLSKLKNVNYKQAIKHPNWKMGKKISIDSATMMNKVFETIEAKKIFDISYKKLSILIHPKSYVHAIIKLKNGLTKIVVHDTSMKIPIYNSLYSSSKTIISKKIDLKILNNLDFKNIDYKRFPLTKILNILPEKSSLFETILVSINDKLVELFLDNRIKYTDISKKMHNMLRLNSFKKYKIKKVMNIKEIINLNNLIKNRVSLISK
ncbi:1-deoxy-D-xylulose-5-phosphate reductoisomerase [Candidatus Pelagibacter sp. HIMB1483]|uniref:1-deoxy-D-xylulose-5-phosphate reductoisomerase n=1 Tax=Candidatus Pelagibacter sp. HIMB1483 TaxID=3415414 RepID=UPI003F82F19A